MVVAVAAVSAVAVRGVAAGVEQRSLVAAGASAKAAFAAGSCVDACVSAFGVTFENSRGDFFVLKDCATSELGTGTVYCTYARLPA